MERRIVLTYKFLSQVSKLHQTAVFYIFFKYLKRIIKAKNRTFGEKLFDYANGVLHGFFKNHFDYFIGLVWR